MQQTHTIVNKHLLAYVVEKMGMPFTPPEQLHSKHTLHTVVLVNITCRNLISQTVTSEGTFECIAEEFWGVSKLLQEQVCTSIYR